MVMNSRLEEHAKMAWLPSAAASSLNRTLHAVGSQSYGKYTQNESAGSCSSLTCARQSHELARGHPARMPRERTCPYPPELRSQRLPGLAARIRSHRSEAGQIASR